MTCTEPAAGSPPEAGRGSATPLGDWAGSGAMALTGRAEGPPLAAPGDPAGGVRRSLAEIARLTAARTGTTPSLPSAALLGERAALAGLARQGPTSCGGAFRSVRCLDGWLGLSLPRETDLDLVGALVAHPTATGHWPAVARWAAGTTTAEALARVRLLGLAGAAIAAEPSPATPGTADDRSAIETRSGPRRRRLTDRPRVVDLTSLWAGPLCSHLLHLGGAEVIKVESGRRPDGARSGSPIFFDLLHGGKAMVALDLTDPGDQRRLRDLVASADLVLEASRPRALAQIGVMAEEVVEAGTSWLSITAHGRSRNWIGFGDDVASGAGLIAREPGRPPMPCGDALADPLAGVAAALAASRALLHDRAELIDVSMHHVAAAAGRGRTVPHRIGRRSSDWWVESDEGDVPVRPARARVPQEAAGALGADTGRLLP
ncbi:MAG: CoA transferase [Nocardioides sp.]|uniref:CoA transferase n=1 Tax=Nocardioides sp. TaxID=35761 RepID=UPI0039E3AA70